MSAAPAFSPRSWFVPAVFVGGVLTLQGQAHAQLQDTTPATSSGVVTQTDSNAPPSAETQADADQVASCLADHALGQEARMQSHLLEASTAFTRCSDARCPEMVRADCVPWLVEVQAQLPHVSFEFARGVRVQDVRAYVDEQPIDVMGIEPSAIDPGAHDFRFELAGHLAAVEHIVLLAGDPPRRIRIAFTRQRAVTPAPAAVAPGRAPRPQAADERISSWTWVFGGVGALGLGVAAYFGVSSLDEKARLRRQCAPLCRSDDLQTLQQRKLIADIGLGVGVLGAGLATAVYLITDRPSAAEVGALHAPNWQLYLAPSSVALALEDRF